MFYTRFGVHIERRFVETREEDVTYFMFQSIEVLRKMTRCRRSELNADEGALL
jgi:hypothetical protein